MRKEREILSYETVESFEVLKMFHTSVYGFAVIAKVKEKQDQKPKEGKPLKLKTSVTKGDVLQALCQKCNRFIFQGKRPSYHQGQLSLLYICYAGILLEDG